MSLGMVVHGFPTLDNMNDVAWRGFSMSIYEEHCLLLGAPYSTSYLLYIYAIDLILGTEHILLYIRPV